MEIIKVNYVGGKPANPKKLKVSQKFAELALKKNNVSRGGYYMTVSDLPKYFSVVEKPKPEPAPEPVTEPVTDLVAEPAPKRRRKPKSI